MTALILMRGQLRALRESGFEVALVAGPGQEADEAGEHEGVTVFKVPMVRHWGPISDFRSLVALWRIVREYRPLVVVASTPKAGLLGMVVAAACRVPHRVYLLRGLPLETLDGIFKRALVAAERIAALCATQVIAVSESLLAKSLALRLFPPEKGAVIGPGSSNGVDVGRFCPATQLSRLEARRTLGLPPESPVLVFVGRLTRDKGIVDLSEAFFERILPAFPASRLVLCGQFEDRDAVSEGIRARLLSHDSVIHLGFSENPEEVYRAADVLVFPSYREGFPNAPLEASASGIPVAGYSCTGTVDAVSDGNTGTLVKLGDRAALSDALIQYLQDPDLREKHGVHGRERAVKEFRQEIIWNHWTQLFRQLVKQSRNSW